MTVIGEDARVGEHVDEDGASVKLATTEFAALRPIILVWGGTTNRPK